MIIQNRWQQLRERKQNNKGSSLVLVVATMAIVTILVVVLLELSLLSFRMKCVNLNSQNNFYDAESVLDQIKQGLAGDVSDATSSAYITAIENYNDRDSLQRKTLYIQSFEEKLLAKIKISEDSITSHYSIDHLESMLPASLLNSGRVTIAAADNKGILNIDASTGTYTIKNLLVTYTDSRDYMTQIQTDIVISCPKLDFTQQQNLPELMNYSFIANHSTSTTSLTSKLNINGNAYLGKSGAQFSNCNVIFQKIESIGRIVTGDQIFVGNGATLTISKDYETWAKEILVDSSTVNINGVTYLSDDLTLANSAQTSVQATLNGKLYAYGANSNSASVFAQEPAYQEAFEQDPAGFSSSILINGTNAKLDLSGLSKIIIAGNSYVSTRTVQNTVGNKDVIMGESISLKSDQRAYLVPAEYIASFCDNGRVNPMLNERYLNLEAEMKNKLSKTTIESIEFFRTSADTATEPQIPIELQKYNVTGIQKAVYPVTLPGGETVSMVYFFLTFESPSDAMAYGNAYYGNSSHLANLKNRMDITHYNTTIKYPSNLLDNTPTDFTCYFNGSILVPEESNILTGGWRSSKNLTATALAKMEEENQNQFAALRHKLVDTYSQLTTNEKTQDIYTNLVNNMISNDSTMTIAAGYSKLIKASDDSIEALVVNGDYTFDGTDNKIHLIIANGNVTVKADYTGLIIAQGDVIFDAQNVTMTADKDLVLRCLKLENEYGIKAADYLINGDKYFGSTLESDNENTGNGTINFEDCINYTNWSKQ